MLTTKQVATELGISARRVLALIHAGRLKAVKVGRDWLINEHDLRPVRERRPGPLRKEHK